MADVSGASSNIVNPSSIEVVQASGGVQNVNGFTNADDTPRIFPRQSVTGVSRGIQLLGSPDVYVDSDKQQIIAAPDGIPQVLMGNQPNFGEGFYVTKPGIDATITNNAADFIFNSNQDVFKIVKSDTVTFSKGANVNSANLVVAHGLGYAPLVTAYFYSGGFYYPFGQTGVAITGTNSGKVTESSSLSVDATNIYFQVLAPDWAGNGNYTSAETYMIKYYLLGETAS